MQETQRNQTRDRFLLHDLLGLDDRWKKEAFHVDYNYLEAEGAEAMTAKEVLSALGASVVMWATAIVLLSF